MRIWIMSVALAWAASTLGGCAQSTGTETGNPPIIARTLVQVAEADEETVTVAGEAGAVTPGGGELRIENQTTGASTTVAVSEDGSFSATVPGTPEDSYSLIAILDGSTSDPKLIEPIPSGASWQKLHACADDDPMDPVRVVEVSIAGDTMTLEVSHSGGCAEHAYGLCFEQEWDESYPIQLGFRVLHDAMGDGCEAELRETLTFDLTPFKRAYERAYRTEDGAASISFAACQADADCTVLYEWGQPNCDDDSCGTPDLVDLPEAPADWVRHETPCMLSFIGPSSLEEVAVQGTDSCVLEFTAQGCVLSGGRGAFSNGLSEDGIGAIEAYERRPTLADGREASFVTATTESADRPYFAGVHIPLGESSVGGISAELYVHCETPEAREALIPALGTIQIEADDI